MTKKIDIINGAYSQLRISGLTVQPTPEDVEVALERLENMVSEIDADIGYQFENTPDVNTLTNVDRKYWHALETNLAVRLIPDFNKQVPSVLMVQASQSLSNMLARSATMRETVYPNRMPVGRANTLRRNRLRRYYTQDDRAPNEPQTVKMFIGEIEGFVESFDSELRATETLSSYTLTADDGLFVVSEALTSPNVEYTIRADGSDSSGSEFLRVVIEVTTSLGRKIIRPINFEVSEV